MGQTDENHSELRCFFSLSLIAASGDFPYSLIGWGELSCSLIPTVIVTSQDGLYSLIDCDELRHSFSLRVMAGS